MDAVSTLYKILEIEKYIYMYLWFEDGQFSLNHVNDYKQDFIPEMVDTITLSLKW